MPKLISHVGVSVNRCDWHSLGQKAAGIYLLAPENFREPGLERIINQYDQQVAGLREIGCEAEGFRVVSAGISYEKNEGIAAEFCGAAQRLVQHGGIRANAGVGLKVVIPAQYCLQQ